jgi:integrase
MNTPACQNLPSKCRQGCRHGEQEKHRSQVAFRETPGREPTLLTRGAVTVTKHPRTRRLIRRRLRYSQIQAARALEFTILTACRTREVIGARWDEFDLDENLWTIPEARMKAELAHRVPLSPAALAVLEGQKGVDDVFVFPGDKAGSHLSNGAMAELVKEMHAKLKKADNVGYVDPHQSNRRASVHGMRSTFKDWYRSNRATKYPDEIAELALAHVNDDKTRNAYARDDLLPIRAQLMDDWAAYCQTKPAKGNVTPIKSAAA